MSKLAQLKALREAKHEKRQAEPKPVAKAKQVITNITNTAKTSPSERSLKWRSENPERYKETQRNLMRKKRGSKKDAGSE
jgi:hypothetical protein